MFPEDLVPYDWESLREIALQGLDERGQLQEIYRARVLGAFDMDELAALTNLRRLCDDRTWDEQSARIIGSCEDRHQECLEYLKELIQLVRIYMDSVARNADPETSARARRRCAW